ncbi:MAG TPA: MFS transporter [Acidimicrobiales bacterium]
MPLPTALRPLRHRDFALLAGAGLISHIGTWMQTVAVGALVIDQTGQATWVALVAIAQFLPLGLLSPVGGALADRMPRKPFLVAGYSMATVVAFVLAGMSAAGRLGPGVLVGFVLVGGTIGALLFPFQQAILPELVPPDDLVGAVSIGSAEFNLGRVVGPALAGVVIAGWGATAVFVINGVSFLAIVVAVGVITLRPPAGSAERMWRSIRSGAKAAWTQPACRAAVSLIGIVAIFVSPFIALVPAVADLFADGEKEIAAATGTLITVQGIGAVLGAFASAPLTERFGHQGAFTLNTVGVTVALVLYAASPTLVLATLSLFLVGFAYIGILNGLAAVVQLRAPEEFRGRIISLYFTALTLIYPLGAFVHGAIADAVGLRFTTAGAAMAMMVILAGLTGTRRLLPALDPPSSEAASTVGAEPIEAVT